MPMSVIILISVEKIVWFFRNRASKILHNVWDGETDDPPEWIGVPYRLLESWRYWLQHAINRRGYDVYGNKLQCPILVKFIRLYLRKEDEHEQHLAKLQTL